MDLQPQLLVVANSPALVEDILAWVIPEGYHPVVATTFEAGNLHLRTNPRAVITQLRLNQYNGLHLALHARQAGIPAVVIGEADAVLERDASQLGATFVKRGELGRERIVALLQDLAPAPCGAVEQAEGAAPARRPANLP